MSQADRRWRAFVTRLLCAFLLVAGLDKSPDPPAVDPQGTDAKTSCLGKYLEGPFILPHKWPRAISAPVFVVRWFDFARVFKTDHPACSTSLVRQAADSSPPPLTSRG